MNNNTLKDRLIEFIDYLNISRLAFEQSIEKSNGWASKPGNTLRDDVRAKLTEVYPQLNINWLLTGEGTMLKNGSQVVQHNQNGDNINGKTVKVTKDSSEKFLEVILEQSKQISKSQEQIDRLISIIEQK